MASRSGSDAFLVVTSVQGNRTVFLEQGNAWSIGRTPQSQVPLLDDLVSRNHALIQSSGPGKFSLIDLGSRNGSFVNGRRVSTPLRLKDGDRIQIGGVSMTFHGGSPPTENVVPSQALDPNRTRVSFVRRLLTVLVVDICDFTGLAQEVEENIVCQVIGTWFSQGGRAAQDQGSWTQKYIGDAIMSVWLHDSREPDLVPVLKAYLEIARLTADLGGQFSLRRSLTIGAAINTGSAIIGNTGSQDLADFTATGDTVIAAFRIETAAKQLGVDLAVGAETFQSLKRIGEPRPFFKAHSVNLKGFADQATVWSTDQASVQRFLTEATQSR